MESKNFTKVVCGCLAGISLMFSPLSKEAEAVVLARFRVNGASAENQRELLRRMVPGAPENCVITDDPELGFQEAAGMGMIEFGCPEDLIYFVDDIDKNGYNVTDKYRKYYDQGRKDNFNSHKKLRARSVPEMNIPAGFKLSRMSIGNTWKKEQAIGFGIFNSQKGFRFDGNGNLISIDPNEAEVMGDFSEIALGGAYFNCRMEMDKKIPAREFLDKHMNTSAIELSSKACIGELIRGGGEVFRIESEVGFEAGVGFGEWSNRLMGHSVENRKYYNSKNTYIKAGRQVRDFVKERYAQGEY